MTGSSQVVPRTGRSLCLDAELELGGPREEIPNKIIGPHHPVPEAAKLYELKSEVQG